MNYIISQETNITHHRLPRSNPLHVKKKRATEIPIPKPARPNEMKIPSHRTASSEEQWGKSDACARGARIFPSAAVFPPPAAPRCDTMRRTLSVPSNCDADCPESVSRSVGRLLGEEGERNNDRDMDDGDGDEGMPSANEGGIVNKSTFSQSTKTTTMTVFLGQGTHLKILREITKLYILSQKWSQYFFKLTPFLAILLEPSHLPLLILLLPIFYLY